MKSIIMAVLLVLISISIIKFERFVYITLFDPMSAFKTPAPIATPLVGNTADDGRIILTPSPTPSAPLVTNGDNPSPTAAPTPTPTIEPTPNPTLVGAGIMDNKVNILLLGYDESPERVEDEESELFRDEQNDFRSDVLMLLTVNFANKKASLISIPRDSYAPIYNDKGRLYSTRGRWKINAAFAKGGSQGSRGFLFACNTVEKLLGVPVDYYAGVDMSGLKGVVNAMGGVYYDVDIPIRLNGRSLKTGYQKLNGQQVLDYCRARKGISTDAGRNDRQQRILFAIFEQLKTKDQLKNFPKIYKSMRKYIRTNLKLDQILAIAAFSMQLDMEDLSRHTISGEYNSDTPYSNAGYYLIDNEKLKALIKELFNTDIEVNPRYDINYVKADIAAAAAKKDIKSAEYILGLNLTKNTFLKDENGDYINPPPVLNTLLSSIEELRRLSVRDADADLDISLDEQAINAGRNAIYSAMSALLNEISATKRDVAKSRIPEVLYSLLPDE